MRAALRAEYDQMMKNRKFGLVFEEHLPECTPLWGMKIRRGMTVAKKDGDFNDVLQVQRIKDGVATCWHASVNAAEDIALEDLIPIARFGDPIYPVLTPIDAVENAPGDKLWHTLIQADNYHALQLLEYLYKGKVDCIYIDPPYNTGARDWKYNNDYVDANDAYRHSKWLSMMQKRLRLAKKLLNPKDGVLIVTIDEHEVQHLRCLLEEILPEAYIQMVTVVINPKGSTRDRFSRVEEYIVFCFMPDAPLISGRDPLLGDMPIEEDPMSPRWKGLLNSGTESRRSDRPDMYYPILVDDNSGIIVKALQSIPITEKPNTHERIDGYFAAWPFRSDGSEGRWMLSSSTFNTMLEKGLIGIGRYDAKRNTYGFTYLSKKYQEQLDTGELKIVGRSSNGQTIEVRYSDAQSKQVKTVWHRKSHDAGAYGSDVLTKIFTRNGLFAYPKSLYAVHDTLACIVANKPNALILDFFAGSGTTLHAVNLLNAEDGGKRQCIMVTNNEVSEDEAKGLRGRGFKPGDDEWERLGIAKYVTWPRTVCSIEGHDVKGNPLNGSYGVEIDDFEADDESAVVSKVTGKPTKKTIYKKTTRQMYPAMAEMAMADGFKANAAFFKLDFLDKDSVALGKQFKALLPILWMKSGAKGKRPNVTQQTPAMLVLPENEFAVLTDEASFLEFEKQVKAATDIRDVYLVTDSNNAFKEMALHFKDKRCIQLYRDYLDNFRINKGER